MRITDLRVNDRMNPIGICLENLTFSWRVEEAEGKKEAWARLEIAEDDAFASLVFDSGKGKLPRASYTPGLSGLIRPGKKYRYRVSVCDDLGNEAVSEIATFEGGRDGAFAGTWISPKMTRELHPVMRKTFTLSKEEVSREARLYICGLGVYEAYLNGKKIGNEYLAPYFTDYRYRIQYQTYDLEGCLQEGENTLDVWLGNGWYKGRFGYLAGGQLREYYGDSFKLLADVKVGERVIGTDRTWKCLRSPVLWSGIYDGESYDSRREAVLAAPSEQDLTDVQEAEAPAGELIPMLGLPVTAHEVLPVREIIRTKRGETVLDFGQEITGWVEFEANAPLDARVRLYYSEVMQDQCFYRENLRTADAEFEYASDGTRKTARPHFTFYGFRYVKVTGMEVDESNAADFRAVALYSDLQELGQITTANEKVNRLISNTRWSEKDNFLDVPTDCPQRDERLGWTGDAEIFSGAASRHMRTQAFFRKYLKDMADEQREKGGAVPYVVPDVLMVGREKCAEPPFDITKDGWGEAGSCVWGDAATIIPWNMYLHSGNLAWLSEQYDNMKQWCDFMIRMDEEHCGGGRLWTCGFHFGDWLSLDVEETYNDMDNREGGTDKYFVASVFYSYSAGLTAKAAALLGKSDDAEYYGRISREVRDAVRAKYVTGPGELSIRSQTAYALAIHLNVFDEAEKKAGGDRLAELLHLWNDHLATGFVGTAYLCDALTETGHADLAYTLLFNEDYPSWLYEVNLGATTIWERWNSILPDGKISGTGMNSLNHYAYGVIVDWIYASVCGLNLVEDHPAGAVVRFNPHPDARLGSAHAQIAFAAGTCSGGWEMKGDAITFTFTVPFDGKLIFEPDRELNDLRINGEKVSALPECFEMGSYTVEARAAK